VDSGYLQLVDNQPGGVGVLPLPDSDSGPFLSYAWQWLTFGAMALFGLGYFIRLELLQRRAPDEPDPDEPEPAVAETSPRDPPPTARPEPEPAPGRDRLAERYGKARF
jgi:hypothetical protein